MENQNSHVDIVTEERVYLWKRHQGSPKIPYAGMVLGQSRHERHEDVSRDTSQTSHGYALVGTRILAPYIDPACA